ncbi:MAG: class II fructose-bisphosphate aldolase [Tissierella sp.]|nr:class II fructose-bisphosphate aldolase [Tissierella sp.]
MIVSLKAILDEAKKNNYGVAAANVFDMNTVKAVYEVASELRAPIIINCHEKFDMELIGEITRYYDKKYPEVVVALNLDHGSKFESAVIAIKSGFTSVMVDRSKKPFEDNVYETKEIVKMAHAVGVSVEAELGHVGKGIEYKESKNNLLTEPLEALDYVNKTSVDCLAIAIGTAHGQYVGETVIDYDRLEKIRDTVPIPLVLHGGSSTGDENLKKAVDLGISKINLFTDLIVNSANEIKKHIGEQPNTNFINIIDEGIVGYKDMLKHYICLFGSQNRY